MKAKYFYFFICLMGLNLYAQNTLPEDSIKSLIKASTEISNLNTNKNLSSLNNLSLKSLNGSLYEQGMDVGTVTGYASQVFTDLGNGPVYSADDFSVPNGQQWNITQIQTLGFTTPPTGDVELTIWSNDPNSSVPSNIVYRSNIVPSSIDINIVLDINLNMPLILSEGTYWITVAPIMSFNGAGQWFWGVFDNLGNGPTGFEGHLIDPNNLLGFNVLDWTPLTVALNAGPNTVDYCFRLVGTSSAVSTLAFQEVVSRNGFALGSVAFGDVDGDSDQDLTVTGSRGIRPNGNAFGPQVSWLFKNDGSGFFDYDINAPFMGMSHASSVFRDFNNDGNLDFMSTGENFSTGVNSVNIYENDGAGNFSLSGLTALDNNLKRRDFVYANLDGDPEEEILVIGITNGGVARTIVYDWQGSFYKRINVPTLPRVRSGSIDVADVDADGDMDVFVTGRRVNNTLISGLYLNNGNFQFTQDLTSSFTPVSKGDSKFSDVDNDGDMDLIMSGIDSSLNNVMKLYLNDGSGVFTEEMNVFPDFPDVLFDSYNTADIDGDGDMDIILGGYNTVTFKATARIWENLLLSNPNRTQQKPNTFALNFPENDIVNFGDNFSLYPNPAKNGVFSIKTPNFEGDTTLSISNVMGNEIIRKDVNISRQEVQVEAQSLKRGMYIVKLSQGLNTYTARLMVE